MAIAYTKQAIRKCAYATIHVPYHLRNITAAKKEIIVPLDQIGSTIKSLLDHLFELYPSLSPQIIDEEGKITPVISVYLNGKNIKNLEYLNTELTQEINDIKFRPAIAGG